MRKHANEGRVETVKGIGMYTACVCVCGRDVRSWFYDTFLVCGNKVATYFSKVGVVWFSLKPIVVPVPCF